MDPIRAWEEAMRKQDRNAIQAISAHHRRVKGYEETHREKEVIRKKKMTVLVKSIQHESLIKHQLQKAGQALRMVPAPTIASNACLLEIAKRVAQEDQVPWGLFMGPSRNREAVYSRQKAFYYMREAGGSYAQIGRVLDRDHTTVMYGAKQYEARLEGKPYSRGNR